MKTAYKVLTVVGNGLYSFNYMVAFPNATDRCQRYSKKKVVKPKIKGSRLFVFEKLEDAQFFLATGLSDNFEIWRVEVPELFDCGPMFYYSKWENGALKRDDKWGKFSHNHKIKPPDGTKLCDSLKLIERVAVWHE